VRWKPYSPAGWYQGTMKLWVRQGDRLGCGYIPAGHSSLIKAGVLYKQWCLKCGHRCWVYGGERYRFIELSVKV
jgi:hypothetical protein